MSHSRVCQEGHGVFAQDEMNGGRCPVCNADISALKRAEPPPLPRRPRAVPPPPPEDSDDPLFKLELHDGAPVANADIESPARQCGGSR